MFDYPVPYTRELKQLYKTPYKFSDRLTKAVDNLFLHPYNTHSTFYAKHRRDTDPNDMCKSAYLTVRYYMDYPQQFAHSLDNIAPTILTNMWKTFININKRSRLVVIDDYLKLRLSKLLLNKDNVIDILLEDIKTSNYKLTPEPTSKYYDIKEQDILYYESIDYG